MKTNKILSFILFVLTVMTLSACAQSTTISTTEAKETPIYTTEDYTFTTIYTNDAVNSVTAYVKDEPEENGSTTFEIGKNIAYKSYIKLEVETSVNLVGYFNYYNSGDPTQSNSEKFYIPAGSSEYKGFLDSFRNGAYGAYSKILDTITIQNVSDTEGTFTLKSVSISDRTLNMDYMMYIDDGGTKLGTSLAYGGCIQYLSRIDSDVVEYIDSSGNVQIDRDIDPDEVTTISTDVNFINCYDLGREGQTSYYWSVTSANGYNPKTELLYEGLGGTVSYNPIQCGTCGRKSPQIIDYEYHEDYIYVKALGADWFFENDMTQSYLETKYYFNEETGCLMVENAITNFTQFTNTEKISISNHEMPAFYVVYPLNYFYCDTKYGTIMDDQLSYVGGSADKTTKNESVTGRYHYLLEAKTVPARWAAFVNGSKFGVGLYMPNSDYFLASRGNVSSNYMTESANTSYESRLYTFSYDDYIPSYVAMNYNYLCPSTKLRMVDYVKLEFTYAVFIGDTDEMSEAFEYLNDEGILTQTELAWSKR